MKQSIVNVDSKVIEVRGVKVILDFDIAKLYDVETREINQAVKNNPDKFPDGYILALNKGEKDEVIKNFDNLPTLKFSPSIKAFTEKGLYMLATILKSPKATETTLAIIETFAKIRELTRTVGELAKVKKDDEKKPLMQKSGEIIADVLGDALAVSETETTLELNLAVLNFKHTVRKKPPRKTTKRKRQ